VAARAPGEARGARQRLAGADHLGAAAELVPHRLLERHPPLLVGGQAIGAKTALREAGQLMRELDRRVAQAARQLGMSRQALYRRMEKLGIKEAPGRLPS